MKRLIVLLLMAPAGVLLAQTTERPNPAILSRGLGTVLQGGGELLRVRPYLSVTGIYDTGLTPVAVDAEGRIPVTDDYGAQVEFGVYGYHRWRRSLLGVDYRGNVRHYGKQTYYDSSDHTLTLGVTHELSRQLSLTLREAAGTHSRSSGTFSGYQFFDPAYANVPADELFNGRTDYLSSMGDLTLMANPRLSFSLGGGGTIVRRRSRALVGMNGWSANGDMAYEVNRRFTIGTDYAFSHNEFTNKSGISDMHVVSVDLSFQLGRRWDLGLRAGGARVEWLGRQTFALDPVLAAIFGQNTLILVSHNVWYVPSLESRLSRVFRRSSLSFSHGIGISQGNGVYLTSRTQHAGLGYSITTLRRWNLGVSAGYSSSSSFSQQIGEYVSYSGGGGFTCKLSNWAHIVGRYDARRYHAGASALHGISHGVSLGIAFSPGELPLSLW